MLFSFFYFPPTYYLSLSFVFLFPLLSQCDGCPNVPVWGLTAGLQGLLAMGEFYCLGAGWSQWRPLKRGNIHVTTTSLYNNNNTVFNEGNIYYDDTTVYTMALDPLLIILTGRTQTTGYVQAQLRSWTSDLYLEEIQLVVTLGPELEVTRFQVQGPVSQKSWNFSGIFGAQQFLLYLCNAEVLSHQTSQSS